MTDFQEDVSEAVSIAINILSLNILSLENEKIGSGVFNLKAKATKVLELYFDDSISRMMKEHLIQVPKKNDMKGSNK